MDVKCGVRWISHERLAAQITLHLVNIFDSNSEIFGHHANGKHTHTFHLSPSSEQINYWQPINGI